ncbi:protease complex subunit PrcB family protein [Flavobacterium cucumis]|uniref:PrcB C-terminal n=2 Tax=Flavobacterium cucumis TaxID=416016 RepID=A0A1M7ZYG4_9FLAO|nr:PrcB C-terminal [Flavobacterium cucumis]
MMNKIIPFFAVILFSCNPTKDVVNDDSYRIIYERSYGGQDKKGHVHIKDNESYIQLIESLKIDESELNQLAVVDFKKNDVIVLFQGQQATGGFAISIDSIKMDDGVLKIKSKEKTPEKGAMVTMALTSPYCIALIPKVQTIIIE